MVRQRPPDRRACARLAIGSLLGAVLLVGAPFSTFASTPTTKLGLSAVAQPGSFFDLTMDPGQHKTLGVILSNDGTVSVAARTYAADVYTIVNGGFGGRLRDEPQTGMTSWVDYPSEALHIAAGERTRRSFDVEVPGDAGPGEYITSVVLEYDVLPQVGAGVEVDQVVRQAVAVVVTVPGARVPAIDIGAASHQVAAGKSIVSVAVRNTGNIRLKPLIDFTLTDAGGATVSHASVAMDSFYARTATTVEVPLAALLLPGRYTVGFSVGDTTQKLAVREASIPLVVDGLAGTGSDVGESAGLTDVIQGLGTGMSGVIWAALICAVLALGLLVVGGAFAVRRRRSRSV